MQDVKEISFINLFTIITDQKRVLNSFSILYNLLQHLHVLRESKTRREEGGLGTIQKRHRPPYCHPLPPCIPWLTIFRVTLLYSLSQIDKEGPEVGEGW